LAAPAGTDDGDELPFLHREIDAVQRQGLALQRVVPVPDAGHLHHRHPARPSAARGRRRVPNPSTHGPYCSPTARANRLVRTASSGRVSPSGEWYRCRTPVTSTTGTRRGLPPTAGGGVCQIPPPTGTTPPRPRERTGWS